MMIEICSRNRALELVSRIKENISVISITSKEEKTVSFPQSDMPGGKADFPVFHLQVNDLTSEYDEEGIPYGRPLPAPEDLEGLRDFVNRLACERLIVHCNEGISRSAAVAAAIYEYRGRTDTLWTYQDYAPNRLVYALACRELGIVPGNLWYEPDRVSGDESRGV